MSTGIPNPNLQENEALLSELFEDVRKWEGTLAGGKKLSAGAAAIDSLMKSKISFGNPRRNLVALTPETFAKAGLELNWIHEQHLPDQYDFYYLTLMVNMQPKPGAQYRTLTCRLDFGPKGSDEPIIESIFPTNKWRPVLNWGGGMSLGLNSKLEWAAGLDTADKIDIPNLPVELEANVENKNSLKSFITIPDYKYDVGRFDIAAMGEGGSDCYWRIEESNLQEMTQVQFAVVFKVPKGTKSITLHGIALAEPDINWLVANIRNVFRDLGEKLQNLFRQKDTAAGKLAQGVAEVWTLPLPGASTDA